MILKSILDFFIPEVHSSDEWTYRKYRVFVGVCVTSALYAIIYAPLVIMEEYKGPLFVIFSFAALNFVLPFLVKQGFSLKILANIYIAALAIAETRIMYFSGGVYHTATDPQILALLAMMALLFLGFRFAVLWFFVGLGIIVTFGVLQSRGVEFPIDINPKYLLFQTVAASAGHLLLIFMVINIFEGQKNAAFKSLSEKNKIIEEEKKRSDDLLLNILPAEVMEELKATGKTHAKNYDLVTVLFADFADFTGITEEMPPEDLVSSIDAYFKMIDNIVTDYKVEKIKTVGDAYICAAGLGVGSNNNPVLMVEVAMEILAATTRINEERTAENKTVFEMRIGVHSGPLVAGVVGIKKFAYDIWGDTVNTAARMQQHGDPGKINISGTTRELVKHRFNCEHRGRIDAKHKGLIDMYYVGSKK